MTRISLLVGLWLASSTTAIGAGGAPGSASGTSPTSVANLLSSRPDPSTWDVSFGSQTVDCGGRPDSLGHCLELRYDAARRPVWSCIDESRGDFEWSLALNKCVPAAQAAKDNAANAALSRFGVRLGGVEKRVGTLEATGRCDDVALGVALPDGYTSSVSDEGLVAVLDGKGKEVCSRTYAVIVAIRAKANASDFEAYKTEAAGKIAAADAKAENADARAQNAEDGVEAALDDSAKQVRPTFSAGLGWRGGMSGLVGFGADGRYGGLEGRLFGALLPEHSDLVGGEVVGYGKPIPELRLGVVLGYQSIGWGSLDRNGVAETVENGGVTAVRGSYDIFGPGDNSLAKSEGKHALAIGAEVGMFSFQEHVLRTHGWGYRYAEQASSPFVAIDVTYRLGSWSAGPAFAKKDRATATP